MTNGEEILADFPNATTRIFKNRGFTYIEVEQDDKWIGDFSIEWWNSEYKEHKEKCTWIKYDYRTVCPKEHDDADNPYWRIPENRMDALKYCPYCGKEIEIEE